MEALKGSWVALALVSFLSISVSVCAVIELGHVAFFLVRYHDIFM